MSKRIYILDPGHGGINPSTGQYVTSGKRSPIWPNGSVYYEGVGNRQIASLVAEKLQALGISHAFTVKPNDWLDKGLTSRANKADQLIAASGKKGLLISIHSNGFSDPTSHGFEVFTTPGQTASDKFADVMYLKFKSAFPDITPRHDPSDGDFDKEAKFTVLTASNCPAILLETMFHTNYGECQILMSDFGKQRIANAIVSAIIEMENI